MRANRGRTPSSADQPGERDAVHRSWLRSPLTGGAALCFAVLLSHSEARAGECAAASPECHLENGKQLLSSDPKRAAEELLKSYTLDERTDTLSLYAQALQADRKYALALETWQRVIVFRESEIESATELSRKGAGKKRAAAKAKLASSKRQMEQAAGEIIKLWSNVGRVRVRIPAGQQILVTRDGVEVDVTRDVLVNAGRDELVFTRKDGSSQKVVVEVAAGASAKIDAPEPAAEPMAKPAKIEKPRPPEAAPVAAKPPVKPADAKPAPAEEPAEEPAAEEPEEKPLTGVRFTEEPRSPTMSRVGMGLVAGAVVAGGIAGTLAYLADRDYDRSRDGGCTDGQCPIGPAADLAERSNDRARWAQIGAIAGGAMLGAGVTLWYIGRGKTRRPASEVTLRVAPSSAVVGWRF